MVEVLELADELGLSDAAIRYRVRALKIDKFFKLNNRQAVSESDAQLVRDFWKGRRIKHEKNPLWVRMFIEEVKEEISDRGMTQKQLAEDAGISQSMVVHCLNGYRKVSVDMISKLAAAMEIKPVLCLMEEDE